MNEEESKQSRRRKSYIKLNLLSLFFTAVSFISVTLAWFAYSGLAKAETEINVKAWYIELSKDGKVTSNNIVISLDEIYPGMETVHEVVEVKNALEKIQEYPNIVIQNATSNKGKWNEVFDNDNK